MRIIINQQTIKVLSSNPSQDQSGFFIPCPQILRKEYTIQNIIVNFLCAGCKTINAMKHYVELKPKEKQQYLPKFQIVQDQDKLAIH